MLLQSILPIISNICIYYYISYSEKVLGRKVNINTNMILKDLMYKIYKGYSECTNEFNIDEIMIMQFPYENVININNDNIDIVDVFKHIDDWIDYHKIIYINKGNPNVVSLSFNPIENYIQIDHVWIIQTIDSYT